jgi:hypothetical protein
VGKKPEKKESAFSGWQGWPNEDWTTESMAS